MPSEPAIEPARVELHTLLLQIWNAIFADNLPANVKTAMKLQGRDGRIPEGAHAAKFRGAERGDCGRPGGRP